MTHEETRTPITASQCLPGTPHTRVDLVGVRSECSCGAHWTHPVSRPPAAMDEIFKTHVSYFLRTTATQ